MNFSFHKKFKLLFVVSVSLLFLSSCGVWGNFTTYFNLYYNAKELFDKAEKQINEQEKDIFSTEVLQLPGTAKTDLIKVIEKCSEILQFNSETSYVEETLMMLGKSYYYQNNYQKSVRKFSELKSGYAESDYLTEANLWLAKCQMKLKNYNDALTTLAEVKNSAVTEENDDIIKEAYLEDIVYRVTIEDYKTAIEVANEFMTVSVDDEIKAQVWYEIGRLNMKIDEVENAIIAYKNVFEYSPGFDLEYDAKLKYGIALREAEKSDDALFIFEDMRDEDKYAQDYGEIDLEIAKTNRSLGDIDLALNQLIEVDTLYKNTPAAAAAKYELAQIYENDYKLLDSAAVYYSKATRSVLPKELLKPAKEKNLLFTRYANLSGEVSKYDKQLFYHENPDIFLSDSVAYVNDSLSIAVEISNIKELQEIWAGLNALINQQDTSGFYADTIRALDSLITYDSTLVIQSDTTLTKDSMLVRLQKPQLYDSLFISKFDSLFTSESFTKTRKVNPKILNQKQQGQQNQLANQLPDSLKFKNNPPARPSITADSLHTLLAKNKLELGNLYLTEMNLPDSAKDYYDIILSKYVNTAYIPNALYALGSYYLTINEKQKADSLFEIIYENYRDATIVNAAADKLNKPLIDLNYDPAKGDFENAESEMLEGNYKSAVKQFYKIHNSYPNSEFASKSLYTAGWILENNLSLPDSAVTVYDTLVTKYPTTVYVREIAGKLSYFKQEQRRLELAKKDSLSALDYVFIDSTAVDSTGNFELTSDITEETNKIVNGEIEKESEREKDQIVNNTVKIKEPLWNPRRKK
jgi:outer membrane protein assembly factor BamD (BamD/ComL family)